MYLLQQFLRVNQGELRIYANQGIAEEVKGSHTYSSLPYNLNGTLIDIRIKVRDDVKYILSSELDEE